MTFIAWGLGWLEGVRRESVTETCTIGGIPLPTTVVTCDGETWPGEVKITGNYFKFIFARSDLAENNIQVNRGLIITYKGQDYEVIPDRRNYWYYNDHERNAVVISTMMQNETLGHS